MFLTSFFVVVIAVRWLSQSVKEGDSDSQRRSESLNKF